MTATAGAPGRTRADRGTGAAGRSGTRRGENRAAARAQARRGRRQARMSAAELPRAGRPVRAALARAPFVVSLIAVLALGVGGVLYLNTKIDESGLRVEQAKSASAQLRLQIEELERTIAELSATPRIAAQARALGLVPAGDAAILTLNQNGTTTLLGDPHVATAGSGTEGGGE